VLVRTKPLATRIFGWRNSQATAREILGVDATASLETVRHAYLDLVQIWHPDRFAHDPVIRQHAELVTKRINGAYTRLYKAKRTRPRLMRPSRSGWQHVSPTRGNKGRASGASAGNAPAWAIQGAIIFLVLVTSVAASVALVYLLLFLD
jgi:hypothetical protein